MWTSIISALLELIKSIFRSKEEKEKRTTKEFEIRNTEEEIRKATIVEDVKVKDEHEKLVSDLKNEKDEAKRKEILRRIRIAAGG